MGRKFWVINFAGKPGGFDTTLFSFSTAASLNHPRKGGSRRLRRRCPRPHSEADTRRTVLLTWGSGAFEIRAGNRVSQPVLKMAPAVLIASAWTSPFLSCSIWGYFF